MTGGGSERVRIAIVGGGPAGAVLAARLARAGEEVVVLERSPTWRWHAGGVFASPVAVAALSRAGLDASTLAEVAKPIPAMRVETQAGVTFRLTYGADVGGPSAVGFDRSRLDPALLDLAASSGAEIRRGWHVTALDPDGGRLEARRPDGGRVVLRAAVVVGADGPHSVVARSAGVSRSARLAPRVGLTYHLPDPDPTECRDARMIVLRDGYVGIAPVAGGRLNVGIVLGRSWRPDLVRDGGRKVADSIVAGIAPTEDDPADWRAGDPADRRTGDPADRRAGEPADWRTGEPADWRTGDPADRRTGEPTDWRTGEPTDSVAGAWPVGHRVTRRAGRGWLLVGDAAGFLDPFTGEGLHRALVSTELAAAAIMAHTRGRAGAFDAYERAMQRRFLAKDVVSSLVQGFLGQPALFEYAARRVAARPAVRATMGLVMGDLVPAGRALDPRFLAALLAP